MIIANPIYDTVFKRLMENNRVARFFIETLIEEPVESIVVKPQEHTYYKSPSELMERLGITSPDELKVTHLSVIRFDFLATIRTAEGYKKVLIEIQKAKNAVDLMRFRNYLAEQYKRKDTIEKDGRQTSEPLPIITIYLLGFTLEETDAVAIRVNRTYRDMISRRELHLKSDFIERLTHDCYIVQIPQIQGKTKTRLEQMLCLFEQKYFIDEKGIIKDFTHKVDDTHVLEMVEILHHTGADPRQQKEIEDEWWSYQLLVEGIEEKDQMIEEQKKKIEERERAIKEQKKSIKEKDDAIKEQEKSIKEKDDAIKEQEKSIKERDDAIKEQKKTIDEMKTLMEKMQRENELLKKK